jgi:two-component system NtrC family sensor kinase
MNLVVNAQQAIQGQGVVTVRSCLFLQEMAAGAELQKSTWLELTVTDNGCGIPRENLERIFDPFFTSKEVGKGTGLGLSVSYGIVHAHGGSIHVESVVGEGSTFKVLLPVVGHAGGDEDTQAGSGP